MTLGRLLLCCLFFVPMAILIAIMGINSIQFNLNVTDHLKRAADANSPELAEKELETVFTYLKSHNLTTGYTNILWQTPQHDIGFWYNNLETSYNELKELPKEDHANPLVKAARSNMLIKLRETLIDHGHSGDTVTLPPNIHIYPSHRFLNLATWFCFLTAVILTFIVIAVSENKNKYRY